MEMKQCLEWLRGKAEEATSVNNALGPKRFRSELCMVYYLSTNFLLSFW